MTTRHRVESGRKIAPTDQFVFNSDPSGGVEPFCIAAQQGRPGAFFLDFSGLLRLKLPKDLPGGGSRFPGHNPRVDGAQPSFSDKE